jgi:Protein of unknown function (DUF4197)
MKLRFFLGGLIAALACGGVGSAIGADLGSLSNADASAGLKKALDQGINQAVGKLGVADGFLKNPKVKIDLPPKLAKAESVMRMVGAGHELDDLVTAMNRAAEATQYFKTATYSPLQVKFAPIIHGATEKVKLAETYAAVAKKAVAVGVLKPEDATLDSYVTDKTLDGLFLMMAEEERAIRKDPLGQASNLLKKVFGALH